MSFRWCGVLLVVLALLLFTGQPGIAIWLAATNIVIVLANWRKKARWEW